MRKFLKCISVALGFCICCSSYALANVEVGVGLSSTLSGQYVPGVIVSDIQDRWTLAGSSVGVETSIYSSSTYSLNYYRTWKVGPSLWNNITAGFGGGVAYSQRAYRLTPSSPTSSIGDLIAGPAFRISWDFIGPFSLAFDGIYGIGFSSLGIPPLFQDVLMFSFGCTL